ncbi:MAG: hypothetical protein ACP5QZ_06710 [Candidatus Sumerlaeaceae bacterium]
MSLQYTDELCYGVATVARREGQLIYREVQFFPLWANAAGIVGSVGGAVAIASTPGLPLAAKALLSLLVFSAFVFISSMRLETEVRTQGVYVRLRPFWWMRLNLRDCVSHEPVVYRPIRDYGGWGIRYTWKGRAYNARGNRGVRVNLRDGRHILLGSQKPEELDAAIAEYLAKEQR